MFLNIWEWERQEGAEADTLTAWATQVSQQRNILYSYFKIYRFVLYLYTNDLIESNALFLLVYWKSCLRFKKSVVCFYVCVDILQIPNLSPQTWKLLKFSGFSNLSMCSFLTFIINQRISLQSIYLRISHIALCRSCLQMIFLGLVLENPV